MEPRAPEGIGVRGFLIPGLEPNAIGKNRKGRVMPAPVRRLLSGRRRGPRIVSSCSYFLTKGATMAIPEDIQGQQRGRV